MSFAKNMGKSFGNTCNQKLLSSLKNTTTNPIKTASNRAIQKTAEVPADNKQLLVIKLLIK